jgi:peptidoglycan hydrolase-like protein with peptidoglycan-binding domain
MKNLKNTVITFTIVGVLSINPIFVQAKLGDQTLKEGMDHEDIKVLQQHLVNLNYLDLKETTTYYGDQTVNAVMDFQSSLGLNADGIFGTDSFKALQSILELEPLAYNRVLKEDISGEDVQALQERLKILGLLNIDNCTNYFGSETRQALMDFQNLYGLKVDGIAGKETIEAINDALNGNKRRVKPSSSRGGSRNSSLGETIVSTAKKYIGTPYSYGSSSSSAFDCSGFTQYIYKQHSINIPRSSSEQATAGSEVSKENLQAGDLVIFSNTYKSGPSHAGIYVGNGNFIHSSSAGGGVMISNLSSGYYNNHFSSGRRVF